MTYYFPIMIEECEEGGFYGECPSIPGCHVQGETYEETLEELKAAIEGMIDDYADVGESLPKRCPTLSVIPVEH